MQLFFQAVGHWAGDKINKTNINSTSKQGGTYFLKKFWSTFRTLHGLLFSCFLKLFPYKYFVNPQVKICVQKLANIFDLVKNGTYMYFPFWKLEGSMLKKTSSYQNERKKNTNKCCRMFLVTTSFIQNNNKKLFL